MSGLQVLPLLCQVALAVVFIVSGVAKALDPAGTRQALLDFRVPSGLVPLMVLGLPAAELGTAALLVLPPTGRAGGLAAVALLLGFSAVVVSALRSGRAPQCRCFGSLSAARVSGWTLRRNGALLVLALGACLANADDRRSVAALLAVVGGLALGGLVLASEQRHAARAPEVSTAPQSVGEQSGDFVLRSPSGDVIESQALLAVGRPSLFVFLSSTCTSCTDLVPAVSRWQRLHSEHVAVRVVVSGQSDQAAELQSHTDEPLEVLLEDEWTVRRRLGVMATPAASLVRPDGFVVKTAMGGTAIRRLLAEALSGCAEPVDTAPLATGVPAADLSASSVVHPSRDVDAHDLDGTGQQIVLVHRMTGTSADLDVSGSLVWTCLDGTSSISEIVADLAAVFAAPLDRVEDDVMTLVRDLGDAGFLEDVLPAWAAAEPADDTRVA